MLFSQFHQKWPSVFWDSLWTGREPLFKRGVPLNISPPLSITPEQVDDLVRRLDDTLFEWEAEMGVYQAHIKNDKITIMAENARNDVGGM